MHNEANSGYDMDLSLLGRQWNGFWTQEITSRWDGNGQDRSFWQNWWVLALKNINLWFGTTYMAFYIAIYMALIFLKYRFLEPKSKRKITPFWITHTLYSGMVAYS